MSLFNWSDQFSTGISEFDSQHKVLIETINSLHDSMKMGKGKEVLGETFKKLVEYTEKHFATEENYLYVYNYPDIEQHQAEHKELIRQVKEYENKFKAGKIIMSTDVLDFLVSWLKNHILSTDKKYGPFLQDKGMK